MQVIYGVHPVEETLKDGGRIEKVFLTKEDRRGSVREIVELASRRKIPVVFTDREHLNTVAGTSHHQGVICICEEYRYAGIDEIIEGSTSQKNVLILILDGITDPQNLGSIIRTALCFGSAGLVIPENRAASVTPSVIKASAGAALHLPIARVVNIARTIDRLKEEGFWIYGTDADCGEELNSQDYSNHVGLVLGSEGKGMRPLVRKKCDVLVSIPMIGIIDSLNVSVAGGIILYEITRHWDTLKTQGERG
ncbi:MAG: 23S rRNA (guanosine(2251)-2'-O)-methyltransferase RlmB [Syntrophobacterales bacterium]|nr:MAG: 23S rRNA (guanosine(2251)-2'-O)-methyltransferase RlmB [Syntrophobacterales bacterium]